MSDESAHTARRVKEKVERLERSINSANEGFISELHKREVCMKLHCREDTTDILLLISDRKVPIEASGLCSKVGSEPMYRCVGDL